MQQNVKSSREREYLASDLPKPTTLETNRDSSTSGEIIGITTTESNTIVANKASSKNAINQISPNTINKSRFKCPNCSKSRSIYCPDCLIPFQPPPQVKLPLNVIMYNIINIDFDIQERIRRVQRLGIARWLILKKLN